MGFGNLRLIQRPEDFCYGIDAVILADFAGRGRKDGRKISEFVHIADLGTGNGAVALILSHKIKNAMITAVEMQEDAANLAKRNVALNQLEDRITVIHCDVLEIPKELFGTMDLVVSNPPYVEQSSGLINKHSPKDIARRESTATLTDFMQRAKDLLRDKGDFFMIHRPSRLVDILSEGRKMGMEGKSLLPVVPSPGKEANLILIHFVKNGGKQLNLLPSLQVYEVDGTYTEEIEMIYERI